MSVQTCPNCGRKLTERGVRGVIGWAGGGEEVSGG